MKFLGLKLSGSASKSKKTESHSSTFSNTTTPTVPDWAAGPVQGAAGRIGGLLGADPYSFVAPTNGLQAQAAQGAANLSGMGWNFDAAADLTRGVAQAGANSYQPTFGTEEGYQARTVGAPAGVGANLYGASTARANTYDAATGAASLASGASVLDNLDAYMSPYRQSVVDSALADFDVGAGRTRAQQDLDLAGSGAFGGSGAALTKSMTEGELARGRATTSANLLDQMFQRGAALSSEDADRRQQLALANAGALNQFGLANMDAQNNAAQFNASARNATGQFNASARNNAAQFNASARNSADQFNATARNTANQFNAAARNSAAEFSAGARNQMAGANMAAANAAAQFGAQAQDLRLQRQLDAARGLTDISTAYEGNQRANIATMADVGGRMRDIDQQFRQAPLTHAQQIVAMLQGLPINLFAGEQKTGTESSTGTTKTKGWEVGGEASFGA